MARFQSVFKLNSIFLVRQYILNIMSGKSLRSGDWVILSTLGGGAALLYLLSTMAQAALAPDNSQVRTRL